MNGQQEEAKKYRNVLERDSHETIGNSDVTVSHIYICHTREFEFGAPSKVPSGRMLITEKKRFRIVPHVDSERLLQIIRVFQNCKVGCVFPMVIFSILPHVEFG